jgi:peptide-methionine (S)-S-oxide reductase
MQRYLPRNARTKEVITISSVKGENKTFGKSIVAEVLPLADYWPAEDYQDYFENNPEPGVLRVCRGAEVEKFRRRFAG